MTTIEVDATDVRVSGRGFGTTVDLSFDIDDTESFANQVSDELNESQQVDHIKHVLDELSYDESKVDVAEYIIQDLSNAHNDEVLHEILDMLDESYKRSLYDELKEEFGEEEDD